MTEQLDGPPEGSLGLADFLTQLRVELDQAHLRAASDGLGLRLGVDQVELSLDVVYTTEKAGQANAEVKAKFWVLTSMARVSAFWLPLKARAKSWLNSWLCASLQASLNSLSR